MFFALPIFLLALRHVADALFTSVYALWSKTGEGVQAMEKVRACVWVETGEGKGGKGREREGKGGKGREGRGGEGREDSFAHNSNFDISNGSNSYHRFRMRIQWVWDSFAKKCLTLYFCKR
jgi:hypothetical protein